MVAHQLKITEKPTIQPLLWTLPINGRCVNPRAVRMKYAMHIAHGTTYGPNHRRYVVEKVVPNLEQWLVCYCNGDVHDRNNKYVIIIVIL